MPRYKPEYLFGVEEFVQELRTMSFVIGFGTAPFYAQIPHDRHEEKCRVKVTLNSNSEEVPSVMFEAGGRNYIHACQEVARIAIGELRDRYSDQLADTEYRYHPRQPQGSDRGSYLETEGIENDATTRHLVEMLWAMDESRAETVLAAQDREDRNRGKICKLEDKVDRLEKELAALKGKRRRKRPGFVSPQGRELCLSLVINWRQRSAWWRKKLPQLRQILPSSS